MQEVLAGGVGAGCRGGGEKGTKEPAGSGGVEVYVIDEGGIGETCRNQLVLDAFQSEFMQVNLATIQKHSKFSPRDFPCVLRICNLTQASQCLLGSQLPFLSFHYPFIC